MDNIPQFSVITIVRNDAVGLAATAESVRKQTLDSTEWVVIDGDSTDETKRLALSYHDERTQVLSEPDKGIYDAMNKGLALAKGEYVILRNAGDLLMSEDVLQRLSEQLDREEHDVLYCGSIMDFGVARIVRRPKHLMYILHGQPGLHQATVFRRSVHIADLYDDSYKICGDYDVITRMWAKGLRFGRSDLLLSVNEFDSASASSRSKMLLLKEAYKIQRRNLKLNPVLMGLSLAYRSLSSILSKILTTLRSLREGKS